MYNMYIYICIYMYNIIYIYIYMYNDIYIYMYYTGILGIEPDWTMKHDNTWEAAKCNQSTDCDDLSGVV